MQPQCPVTAVLPDGHLPGERPRHSALLRLRDGDRPHPGGSRRSAILLRKHISVPALCTSYDLPRLRSR